LLVWAVLAYLAVRALRALLFELVLRLRRGYEAPALVRNIFSIIAFTLLFIVIFNRIYPNVNLGALFTTSAIFGVILGLALQDTLGNFFAGISLHADRPFQVGDVISVGSQKHTGVVESISWRAIKIRTFQNHIVLISNSSAAKEAIEVGPRNNLNARLVFFSALYSNSPAKAIHIVREAVREAENVSERITPIVRIRNLGESGVEYEVKYWLEDYARYNDTDALVRQRIWYAFRRAGLTFGFPTRTVELERKSQHAAPDSDQGALIERLSAVDIFAPLTVEETSMLAQASVRHVFAPGETVIRAGDEGASMFVLHNGRVQVQVTENGQPRAVAVLNEGDFFGEMALFTGEPRTANVVAVEETEVLEIGHEAMKRLFDTNPDLVESLSHIIAERRKGLADRPAGPSEVDESEGILASIKRFFRL
jgi:small-conductance mechanosensitive channel